MSDYRVHKSPDAIDDIEVIEPASASNVKDGGDRGPRETFLASFTLEEEQKVLRKIDYRFLLLLGLMHMTKSIDTTNASNVKVLQVGEPSNILQELHMTANQYNWVQTSYYIPYILFEPAMTLTMRKMLPHNYNARIIFTWGAVLACHAALKNRQGFYAARVVLGILEAGLLPGNITQLTNWYRTEDMWKPVMWIYGIQNCAGILGSLLCYGISFLNGRGGLSAWRWVFLIEGLATMALGCVVWIVLPDYPKSPRSSKWLTEREQEFIETRLTTNAPVTEEPSFRKREIIDSLKDIRTWAFAGCQLFVNLGGFGLTWYLPTIITDLGFTKLPNNQLLNIPPSAVAVCACVFSGFMQKKAYISRPFFIMLDMTFMVICFILFFTVPSKGGLYASCILGTGFYWGYFVPFFAWRTSTVKGATRTAFSISIQNGIGQVGGAVGPQVFISKWAYNRYRYSFAICASFIITAWFVNAATWWLTRDVESDVQRVSRLRRRVATQEGRVLSEDDDIRVGAFEKRNENSELSIYEP